MIKKKKATIKFVGRKQSIYGFISTVVGCVGVIALIVMISIATKTAGNASVWLGLGGLVLLAVALAGLLTGVSGFKQKDIFYALPIIGVVLNGVLFIGMVILYFFGLSILV